jgi:pimeloyl-ACP methyl ester carboxylesterase
VPARHRGPAHPSLPGGIAPLEVIAGAGRFTWLDAPDRFWPMIIDFVDDKD